MATGCLRSMKVASVSAIGKTWKNPLATCERNVIDYWRSPQGGQSIVRGTDWERQATYVGRHPFPPLGRSNSICKRCKAVVIGNVGNF